MPGFLARALKRRPSCLSWQKVPIRNENGRRNCDGVSGWATCARLTVEKRLDISFITRIWLSLGAHFLFFLVGVQRKPSALPFAVDARNHALHSESGQSHYRLPVPLTTFVSLKWRTEREKLLHH